jgi:hypothetical protein
MARFSKKYVVFVGSCLAFWALCIPAASAAGLLNSEFSLMHYKGAYLHPQWLEGGLFSEVLERDLKKLDKDYFAKQTNLILNNTLDEFTKKMRITFSPQVIIKPVIIFEELQNFFIAYKSSQENQKSPPIDEDFYIKVPFLSYPSNQAKQVINKDAKSSLSVCPYYNKVYGLYLQITW